MTDLITARSWVIEMPRMRLLNSNHRVHHMTRYRLTRALRDAACLKARTSGVPRLNRAHVLAVYVPPTRRRVDPANYYPSVKAAIDGLRDAGVLIDDDAAHLDGPDMRLGDVERTENRKSHIGRLVLTITELDTPPCRR